MSGGYPSARAFRAPIPPPPPLSPPPLSPPPSPPDVSACRAEGGQRAERSPDRRYLGMGLAAAFLYVGLQARPNTNIMDWAREEAQRRRESAQ